MVAILVALTIRARREHLRSAVWITGVAALAAASPSLTHARTAALLRSGYTHHRRDDPAA